MADWASKNNQKATVQVANDMAQQLSQGFAGGDPADVFYLAPEQLAGYASNGSLLAYGEDLKNKSDFYDNLLQTFTYDGKLYAAPKDVSTLQLVINTDMWSAAGLTDADYPTTWDELATVAKKLTSGDHVGLAFNGEYARIGVFLKQACRCPKALPARAPCTSPTAGASPPTARTRRAPSAWSSTSPATTW